MTKRITMLLFAVTILLQLGIFYQQRQGLAGRPAPPAPVRDAAEGTTIDLRDMPTLGNRQASIVIVEFSDYQCPFCRRHATAVGPKLKETYVASGKVLFAFANNPLPMHDNARSLAVAAICAGGQGKYWEAHNIFFGSELKSKTEVMSALMPLDLQQDVLAKCVDSDATVVAQVDREIAKARELKVNGTPGFAIGVTDAHGLVQVRKLISGAQKFEVFERAIEELRSRS